MNPWSLSLYGMDALRAREEYKGRLAIFVNFIYLTGEIILY